jgi:hypothetical protein
MLSSDADPERATFSVVTVNGCISEQNHPSAGVHLALPTKLFHSVVRDRNVPSHTQGRVTSISSTPSLSPIRCYTSTTAQAPPRPSTLIVGHTGANLNKPYLNWFDFKLAQSMTPQTISMSYRDGGQTFPHGDATSVYNLFAQLGARGAGALFASGDFGVGSGSHLLK